MSNQTHRVLELIRRFNNNKKVCISQLQNERMWYGKSEKTIRRDLDIIKKVFPETFHRIAGEQGCYKAVTKALFENITTAEQLLLLVQTFNIADRSNLFSDLNINTADKAILEKQIRESKNIYLFKSKPFENHVADAMLFKKLEQAIYHRKEIVIDYKAKDDMVQHTVKPYKIVFMNENFYLAGEVEHPDYQFSPYRISKIENVTPTGRNFHQNREIASFIRDMQTPFSRYTPNFKQHLIQVVVEVNSEKAGYFKAKQYLPSQTLLEKKQNGNLILEYTVTQEKEVEELIKRWLPHMKIISPSSLKEKINKDLLEHLKWNQ
jgi:predicted DNA-binding transcriptional regulator YafY